MLSRREWLALTAGAGAAMAIDPRHLFALRHAAPIMRAIPSTGEKVPVVGLGTSATFSSVARSEDLTALREVMKTMVDLGATVFDTAPSYGASEEVGGRIAAELGITNKIFWATKVNTAQRGAPTTAEASRAQIETSFQRLKKDKIDLIQVHNLADIPTQLGVLKDLKKEGRIRYIGVTTTSDNQYGQLEQIMRNEPIDFIGVDYALDAREVEATILPLALERKIGVLVYVPLGRNRLLRRVADKPLPDYASGLGATTWAQLALKYVIAHPAVTAVTPATSQAKHMAENIAAGTGKLPDEATRKQLAALIDSFPPAPAPVRG